MVFESEFLLPDVLFGHMLVVDGVLDTPENGCYMDN